MSRLFTIASDETLCAMVRYETITADKHFQEKIMDYFGEDEAAKLFSVYDASRAEQREAK